MLATVTGWRVGFELEDVEDPPTDPAQDAAAGIARIDNSVRTVLASTQAITRALECLFDQSGGTGTRAPRDRPDNLARRDNQVPPVSQAYKARRAPSGLRTDLTGICAISGRITEGSP